MGFLDGIVKMTSGTEGDIGKYVSCHAVISLPRVDIPLGAQNRVSESVSGFATFSSDVMPSRRPIERKEEHRYVKLTFKQGGLSNGRDRGTRRGKLGNWPVMRVR